MPSSIAQQSAPLATLTLVGPGFLGLNTQLASTTLGPEWALEAKNCVFDDSNRLSARLGWESQTATPASGTPDFKVIFQYLNLAGTSTIVSAGGNKIWTGISSFTDRTGAVAITADRWKFVNFNDLAYGLQSSHALVQYNGAGNFTNVVAASGTVPDGDELLSAFGRLWGTTANGQKLKYSGLLDATNWGGAGAGSFDFTNVWPSADKIVALAAFNNLLVVFGSNNILLLTDGTGSSLGINPTNTFVQDVVPGVGCVSRDTVQNINGDDLAFLSANGVMSLRRVIQEKSNPLRDLSRNVRNLLLSIVTQETLNNLRTTFCAYYGLYLLLCPVTNRIFAFDTKFNIPDTQQINTETSAGAWRVTQWDGLAIKSLLTLNDGKTLYSGMGGKIFAYTSAYKDNGSSYNFSYASGWLTLNDDFRDRFKLLKRISHILAITTGATVTTSWAFDFDDTFTSAQVTLTSGAVGAEYGIDEWGIGEWGPSSSLAVYEVPSTGSGQFIRIALQTTINGGGFSAQQLQIHAKIGRII